MLVETPIYHLSKKGKESFLENIAHTLFGAALGQTGLKKITGMGMATLIISANLPDIDLAWSFYSETAYLVLHRGFTHSFAGFIPQMLILSTIMYLSGKWFRKINPEIREVNFLNLLFLSFLGLFSHLGLDYLNDYGIRPFIPMSEQMFFNGTIFIVDALFWLLLGGYTFLTIELNQRLIILFSLFALASSALLLLFPGLPLISRLIYISGIILLTFYRFKYGQVKKPVLGYATFSIFFIYILAVTQLRHNAEINFSRIKSTVIPDQVEKLHISPMPLNPFRWNFLAANQQFIYLGTVQSLKPEGQVNDILKTNFSDPYVKKALKTEKGEIMQNFTGFLYAYLKKDDKWIYVYLRDARYIMAGEDSFASKVVKFPRPE